VEVETFTYPAKDGDVYLLCSDGLTGMLPEERMAEILRARSSLKQAAQALVDDANARGGKDNITVLLFKLAEEVKEGTDVESDTLSGSDDPEPAAAPEAAGGDTVVLGRDEAEAERAKAATATVAPPSPPEPQSPPPRRPEPPARPRKRRSKIVLAVALSLIVLIAACVGLYEASRQFYFVGTDKSGLITLYRGVPYDLPLGIRLYSTQYESTVPAISLPTRQRKAVLNNRLRGRGDAVDLVRSLERQQQG
jgi:protein phosphatase